MGKQSKSKRPENFGKGKVTPVQIAFIVDKYLSDNNFSETRSVFRNEASSLIAKSPIQEAPKSLLSLGVILNEYICLKEQKLVMDQERVRLEEEKRRIQTLLQGMQNVMKAYNTSGSSQTHTISTEPVKSMALVSQSNASSGSLTGSALNNTRNFNSVSRPSNANIVTQNFTSSAANKRKGSKTCSAAPPAPKRSCTKLPANNHLDKDKVDSCQKSIQLSNEIQSSASRIEPTGLLVQGSSVAKCLFNQASHSIPANSSSPMTPPRENSRSDDDTLREISPTCCTIISKKVTISPFKQVAEYSVERNHCISSSSPVKINLKRSGKREHVKGRLDFDSSNVPVCWAKAAGNEISTPKSEKEVDIFDIELPNLDAFGEDFSFTEMLSDLDLELEGIGCPCNPTTLDGSFETFSGSSGSMDGSAMGTNRLMSEVASTVTQVVAEKETNKQGMDSLTAVTSITKCIRILSPAKKL